MEFCNPGYLGEASDFPATFRRPIERQRDTRKAEQLRRLVQPFILRRLKTDRNVISDLPGCVETRSTRLTREQCEQYERVVKQMMDDVDRSGGIQRRDSSFRCWDSSSRSATIAQMSGRDELNRIVSPDSAISASSPVVPARPDAS